MTENLREWDGRKCGIFALDAEDMGQQLHIGALHCHRLKGLHAAGQHLLPWIYLASCLRVSTAHK